MMQQVHQQSATSLHTNEQRLTVMTLKEIGTLFSTSLKLTTERIKLLQSTKGEDPHVKLLSLT